MGPVPPGVSAADEVSARLGLWEAGTFEALLQRSEQHLIIAGRRRTRGRASRRMTLTDPAEKSSRAKRMAADGAYRKATSSLVSEMMPSTSEEDTTWADKLLPRSSLPLAALSTRMDGSAVAHRGSNPDASPASFVLDSDDSPLKGVKYLALVGPGPTGCRPEDFRDMLSVPRRADANRLL